MLVSQPMPGKAVTHAATPFAALVTAPLKSGVRLEKWEIGPTLRQTATGMEPVDTIPIQYKRSGLIVAAFGGMR